MIIVTLVFLLVTFYFAYTIHYADDNRQRLVQLLFWVVVFVAYMHTFLELAGA